MMIAWSLDPAVVFLDGRKAVSTETLLNQHRGSLADRPAPRPRANLFLAPGTRCAAT